MPGRFSSLFVRRPAHAQPATPSSEVGDGAAEVFTQVGNPSQMRRERAVLIRRREIGIRDVGGLTLEMVRRDRFRLELLLTKADEVVAIEQRINELDSLLSVSRAAGRGLHRVPRCKCGAPIPPGVHFCSHCGRPARTSPPVVACSHCGQSLPAEANFCAACGNAVKAEDLPAADEDAGGATMVRSSADGEGRAEHG